MFVGNTALTAPQLVIGHRIDFRDLLSIGTTNCTYQNVVYKNIKIAF